MESPGTARQQLDFSPEGYQESLDAIQRLRSVGLPVAEQVMEFRRLVPATSLIWPDIAVVLTDANPEGRLGALLTLRQREKMDRVAQEQAKRHLLMVKRPLRRQVLVGSREAMRQILDAQDEALDRRVSGAGDLDVIGYGADIRTIHGRLGPCASGCMSWNETEALRRSIDRDIQEGTASSWSLFSNDGGPYFSYAPVDGSDELPLRRGHFARAVVNEPFLMGLYLRYRGGDRCPETKGLTGEEGVRRTIAEGIAGRRDAINTRSQRAMARVLVPHCLRVIAQRARRLAERRGLAAPDAERLRDSLLRGRWIETALFNAGIGRAAFIHACEEAV